jgi:S-adenosylmethionine decarboxylase
MRDQPMLYSVDLTDCRALAGIEPHALVVMFRVALAGAGATIVEEAVHEFPGTGVTCVLILRESHAVLHTWPESGTVNIDIFSCSTRLRSLAAIRELELGFAAQHVAIQETARADGHRRPAALAGA